MNAINSTQFWRMANWFEICLLFKWDSDRALVFVSSRFKKMNGEILLNNCSFSRPFYYHYSLSINPKWMNCILLFNNYKKMYHVVEMYAFCKLYTLIKWRAETWFSINEKQPHQLLRLVCPIQHMIKRWYGSYK